MMRERRNHPHARRPAAGFTLVELLVGLALTSILLLAIVSVFTAGSKLARVETQVADMQQSLRAAHAQITRLVRMTGRGGLALTHSLGTSFQGPAISVRNDAGEGSDSGEIAVGLGSSPLAVTGSDILTVRGVFETPIYQLNTLNPNSLQFFDQLGALTTDPTQAATGQLQILDTTPTGTPQSLTPFSEALADGGTPEALILVSPIDERIVGVVELNPNLPSAVAGNTATIAFIVRGMTNAGYRTLYESGTPPTPPTLPAGLTSVAYVGILEEYRFYIRQGTPPRLSMARMFPGTETPYKNEDDNLQIDIADHLIDMQVALAFNTTNGPPPSDLNGDGITDEEDVEIWEVNGGVDDDWLFNGPNDDETTAFWTNAPHPELFYLRLSLLGRTARRERDLQAPLLQPWEDVATARIDTWNTFPERLYKRRLQQTVIELRNL